MANSDKNIVITPNRSLPGVPNITLTGFGNSTITLRVPDQSTATLDIIAGITTIASIDSNLTQGTIFSLPDALTIPAIEVEENKNVLFNKTTEINGNGGLVLPNQSLTTLPSSKPGLLVYDKSERSIKVGTTTSWVGYGNDIVKTGLIVHLDASIPESYGGSGTTWFDLSGQGHNGTLQGNPTYTTQNGGAVTFDGNGDYISFSASNYFHYGVGPFTVSMWFRTEDLTTFSILYSHNGSNTDQGTVFANPTGAGLGYFANAIRISDSNVTFHNHWTYVALVGNGGPPGARNIKLYRSSSLGSSSTGTPDYLSENVSQTGSTYTFDYTFSATTPYIGTNHSSFAETMRGSIGHVAIYRRNLSLTELNHNFNMTKNRYQV